MCSPSPQSGAGRRARALALACAVVVCASSARVSAARADDPAPPAGPSAADLPADPDPDGASGEEGPLEAPPVIVDLPLPVDERAPTASSATTRVQARAALGEGLDEALGSSPGVSVRAFGGPLAARQLVVRGASARQVVVSLEGVRLNDLGGGGFDLAMLPTVALDEARVLRGAGALGRGGGAQGGAVDLTLRAPRPGVPEVTLRAGGGSFGAASLEGAALVAFDEDAQGAIGFDLTRVGGGFRYVDDQGQAQRRDNSDGQRLSGFLRAAVGAPGRARAHLIQLIGHLERGAPGPAEYPSRYTAARLVETLAVTAVGAALPALVDRPGFSLDAALHLGHRRARRGYDNPAALLGGVAYWSRADERAIDPQLTLIADVADVSTTHLLLDGRHERLAQATSDARGHAATRSVVGVALIETLRLLDERLVLSAGARYETSTRRAGAFAPRLGATLSPWPWLAISANVARAYRRPSFDELYLEAESVRGDPDLDAELAWQGDLGLRVRPFAPLTFEVVGFVVDHERLILFVPASAFHLQARNLEGARALGLESVVHVQPLPALALSLGHTWTDARFDAPPRDPLPGRPRHEVDARVEAGWGPLSGALSLQYVGRRHLDPFGNRPEEGRAWLSAAVSWRVFPAWSVLGRATNLLDIRDAVDAFQRPLPGLGFFAALTWQPLKEPRP